MAKRSPRYPRHNLSKALEMTGKLFSGAHQSRVDVDTAARVIGYASSTGGAAASAIGALRQFGLVDGLRGDLAVSDLAMRILQPMNDQERIGALREAAQKPEIFSRILTQFGGTLPASDEPVRAFLIRQEGFSPAGANELIQALRETLAALPHEASKEAEAEAPAGSGEISDVVGSVARPLVGVGPAPQSSASLPSGSEQGELIVLPLGAGCKAELRFLGEVTPSAYARLIRHLELLRETLVEDEG
ncbi:MAG TPA: hypothetical protein VEA61_08940 [Allosphingosinicella sp.]|nr:hypothetical protein [Allosphingosinicella sp.]